MLHNPKVDWRSVSGIVLQVAMESEMDEAEFSRILDNAKPSKSEVIKALEPAPLNLFMVLLEWCSSKSLESIVRDVDHPLPKPKLEAILEHLEIQKEVVDYLCHDIPEAPFLKFLESDRLAIRDSNRCMQMYAPRILKRAIQEDHQEVAKFCIKNHVKFVSYVPVLEEAPSDRKEQMVDCLFKSGLCTLNEIEETVKEVFDAKRAKAIMKKYES